MITSHYDRRVDSPDLDPRAHRLQRLNEKSRKTFKRKSKMKAGSVRRYHDDLSDGEHASAEGSPTHQHSNGSPTRHRRVGSPTGRHHGSPLMRHRRRDISPHTRGYSLHHRRTEAELRQLKHSKPNFEKGVAGLARSVEAIAECAVEMKVIYLL